MCAFSCKRVVTSGYMTNMAHGGHAIQSAISKKPMLQAKFMALSFTEPELLPMEVQVLHCENRNFGPFSVPVTLSLTQFLLRINIPHVDCQNMRTDIILVQKD